MIHTALKQFPSAGRQSRAVALGVAAAALLALAIPAAAIAAPAVDEYTLEIPGSKGPKNVKPGGGSGGSGGSGGGQPAGLDSLPPAVSEELAASSGSGSADAGLDELLAQAATSRELGAPGSGGRGGNGDAGGGGAGGTDAGGSAGGSESNSDSIFSVAGGVAGGGSGTALLAGLVLATIAIGLWAVLARRRTDDAA